MFQTLRAMFEIQYDKLSITVDIIGKRIRARRAHVPESYREFLELSSIVELVAQQNATEMVRRLVLEHKTVTRAARSIFSILEGAHEGPKADLPTQRLQVNAEMAWMLGSLLG